MDNWSNKFEQTAPPKGFALDDVQPSEPPRGFDELIGCAQDKQRSIWPPPPPPPKPPQQCSRVARPKPPRASSICLLATEPPKSQRLSPVRRWSFFLSAWLLSVCRYRPLELGRCPSAETESEEDYQLSVGREASEPFFIGRRIREPFGFAILRSVFESTEPTKQMLTFASVRTVCVVDTYVSFGVDLQTTNTTLQAKSLMNERTNERAHERDN